MTQLISIPQSAVRLVLGLFIAAHLVSCTRSGEDAAQSSKPTSNVKVGLVLDRGGRDDKSFNASAFRGASEAQEKLGVELKVVEASDDTAIEPSLRSLTSRGYNPVIAIGFSMASAVEKVAKEFPKTNYVLLDSKLELPNVRAVLFRDQEGSYLAGALAAMTSQTSTIGFVGGMDVPLVRRFELGFRAGAKHQNPKIRVISNYVGTSVDAWKNPMKGKELAISQYKQNADVVFAVAGSSGLGVFDAAEELKKLAIGVDSNQNWIKPGFVLTSMLKRLDTAVYQAIEAAHQGTFKNGFIELGLKDEGVGLAMDEHNRNLVGADPLKRLQALERQIIEGTVQVPDYYVTKSMDAVSN